MGQFLKEIFDSTRSVEIRRGKLVYRVDSLLTDEDEDSEDSEERIE